MTTRGFQGVASRPGSRAGVVGIVLLFACVIVPGCSSPTGDGASSNVAGADRRSDRAGISDPDTSGCRYYQGENPSREEFLAQTQALADRELDASLISAEEHDAAVGNLSVAAPGRSSIMTSFDAIPSGAASRYTKLFCDNFATWGMGLAPESLPELRELRELQLEYPVGQLTFGLGTCIVAEDPATKAALAQTGSRDFQEATISHLCPHLK